MLCRTHNQYGNFWQGKEKLRSPFLMLSFLYWQEGFGMFGVVSAGRNYKKPLWTCHCSDMGVGEGTLTSCCNKADMAKPWSLWVSWQIKVTSFMYVIILISPKLTAASLPPEQVGEVMHYNVSLLNLKNHHNNAARIDLVASFKVAKCAETRRQRSHF